MRKLILSFSDEYGKLEEAEEEERAGLKSTEKREERGGRKEIEKAD